MTTKASDSNIKQLLELREQGLSEIEIAKIMSLDSRTILAWINKLDNKHPFVKPVEIVNGEILCSKCKKLKPMNQFQKGRVNTDKQYIFSYCNPCRKNQIYSSLNSSITLFLKDRYNRLRVRCKKNDIPFELDFEEVLKLWDIQQGKCFYTDVLLTWCVGKGYNFQTALSIDKIVPEKGYISGNVVLCTSRVNTAKSNFALDEIEKWMPEWYHRITKFMTGDF